ncbi:type I-E CRISPR-associated protein Cse2/CasB [Streptomyces sp. NPDC087300]|uniref:type I-E CRISPR-associated protein Cse2/CasB n=1 Tax=Streptomyces sp. NPDC087300 TaxID=3365780 RepID=UPI0037F84F54
MSIAASSSPGNQPLAGSGSERRRPGLHVAGQATDRCLGRLQSLYRQDRSSAVAALALLRRCIGKEVHEAPESWGNDGLEELATVRAERRSAAEDEWARERGTFASAESGGPSERRELAEERAVFLAITLWSVHQQSVRDANMHARGWGLGRSVRQLARARLPQPEQQSTPRSRPGSGTASDLEVGEALRKRFVRVGTSASFDMLGIRLRELVLLFRDARVPLDYALLADQVCTWQDVARQAEVRRAWGRDFHLAAQRGNSGGEGRDDDSGDGIGTDDDITTED